MRLNEFLQSTDAYQEEEGGSVTLDKVNYDLNMLFRISKDMVVQQFDVDDLKWVLKYSEIDKKRKDSADLLAPLLITRALDGELVPADGVHRLAKAVEEKVKTLPGIFLDPALLILAKCRD